MTLNLAVQVSSLTARSNISPITVSTTWCSSYPSSAMSLVLG